MRDLLRGSQIDQLANNGYNIMNGAVRQTTQVPAHEVYNPPSSSSSALGRAGAQIYGSGFAGRPMRGMDKEFGKKVVPDGSYYQGA